MSDERFWLARLIAAYARLAQRAEGHWLRQSDLNTIAVCEKQLGLKGETK